VGGYPASFSASAGSNLRPQQVVVSAPVGHPTFRLPTVLLWWRLVRRLEADELELELPAAPDADGGLRHQYVARWKMRSRSFGKARR
jgi:hypothetical protein